MNGGAARGETNKNYGAEKEKKIHPGSNYSGGGNLVIGTALGGTERPAGNHRIGSGGWRKMVALRLLCLALPRGEPMEEW